jgi:hypothetical protein
MINQNGKKLSPCIVSWARFALNIKLNRPRNRKKCSITYWHDVINTILSQQKFNSYISNRQNAINNFDYVRNI